MCQYGARQTRLPKADVAAELQPVSQQLFLICLFTWIRLELSNQSPASMGCTAVEKWPHDRRTNPGSAEMRMHELSSGMRLPRAPPLTASILYMRRQRGKRRKGRRGVTDSTTAIAGRCEREQRPSITIGITTSARPLATVAGKRPICTGTPTRFQYRVYTLRCASPPGTRRQHAGTSTALFRAAVPDSRSQKAPLQRRWRRQPAHPSPKSPLVHANGDLSSTPPRTSGQP